MVLIVMFLLTPNLEGKLPTGSPKDFDFFLGHWQAKQRWLQEDMSYNAFTNRVHVYKNFAGHAVQDDNFTPSEQGESYFGTAIRVYDPKQDRWVCKWFDGNFRKWNKDFFLQAEDDTMAGTIENSDKHGKYVDRITFYDIQEDRFSWKMVRRYDGLDKDFLIGEIHYERVKK